METKTYDVYTRETPALYLYTTRMTEVAAKIYENDSIFLLEIPDEEFYNRIQ